MREPSICGAALPKPSGNVQNCEDTEIIIQRMKSGMEREDVGESSIGLISLSFNKKMLLVILSNVYQSSSKV